MATVTSNYGTAAALTITLTGLASSATLTAGRESDVVDNATNKFVDAIVQGKIHVNESSAITANTTIAVYVYASFDDSPATTNIGIIDGADSAEDFGNTGQRDSCVKLGCVMSPTVTTTNLSYAVAPFSVAQLFGGNMPKYWGVWVTHSTGQNLGATATNHVIEYVGIKYDVA